MFARKSLAVLAFAAIAVGCNSDTPEVSHAPPPADWSSKPIDVVEVRFPALDKAIGELKGKIVVMDFWATWCPPCVKNFPHLVEIQKKYADKGVVSVSVSADRGRPGDFDIETVRSFLKKNDARFPNFVLADISADGAELTRRFRMGNALPFMVVLDREGNPIWTSDDAETMRQANEQLDALLEKLTAK